MAFDNTTLFQRLFPARRLGHAQLSIWERLHIDFPLFTGLILIIIVGLTILFSSAGENYMVVVQQLIRFIMAFVLMFLIAQIHPNRLKIWTPWFFALSLLLLVAVLVAGHTGKGAQRWLNLGLFRFQPSELMKLALPMMIAWYLGEHHLPPKKRHLLVASILLLIPIGLIAKQPDLGTAIVVAISGATIILLAGLSWRIITFSATLTLACLPLAWYFMHDYQKERVLTFLNPERDPLGSGYHIIQSKIAIGSGGLLGKGWMQGTQSQLDFLPEHSTDFIFSVLGEEFGLVGSIVLISLYALVAYRSLYIAYHAYDNFTRLLAGSLGLTFFLSVFVNIGMVSGILPVVGLPLPLLSYGGTSVVTLLVGMGILMSISTHRRLVS